MHTLRLDDNVTHQDVSEEGEDDDEGVRRDEQGFHRAALRLRSVPAPVHKAPPVRQAVIVPGKETRHVRDYESLLQAPIEGQLSWGHNGANQVGEGEPDKTGQHLRNAALLLQFGKSSFARAELALPSRAANEAHGQRERGHGYSCLPQCASLPLSSPLPLLLQPALYPRASSQPGSCAVIGLHDTICALTCCFSTQLRSRALLRGKDICGKSKIHLCRCQNPFSLPAAQLVQIPCSLHASSVCASSALSQDRSNMSCFTGLAGKFQLFLSMNRTEQNRTECNR